MPGGRDQTSGPDVSAQPGTLAQQFCKSLASAFQCNALGSPIAPVVALSTPDDTRVFTDGTLA